nr:type I-E CRISPR-associated protein Cse1/CasA [Geodermatophilaceae bacterium]
VLHRALGGPQDSRAWAEIWDQGEFPRDAIARYLERWNERFDLFHPRHPFLQVAGLRTAKNEVFGLERLIADVPNGEPFLTTRQRRGVQRIPASEAARWLVHAQAFDPSGIKSGAIGDDRVKGGKGYPIGLSWSGNLGGVLVQGRTLFDTLMLNLIAFDHGDVSADERAADLPVWERPQLTASVESASRQVRGPVDLFTWPSRRVRLVGDRQAVTGVLICNGDPLTPQNRFTDEPMTAWRRSKPQEQKLGTVPVYMPREHIPERYFWRGLSALLSPRMVAARGVDAASSLPPSTLNWIARLRTDGVLEADYVIRPRAIGIAYGSNNSVIDEIIDDELSMFIALLDERRPGLRAEAEVAVGAAEAGARALGQLAGNLAQASGGEPDGAQSRAQELGYAQLDRPFRTWLAKLGPTTPSHSAQKDWQETAWRLLTELGAELVAETSPAAWIGREVRNRQVNAPLSDIWFRAALRKVLPVAFTDEGVTA